MTGFSQTEEKVSGNFESTSQIYKAQSVFKTLSNI